MASKVSVILAAKDPDQRTLEACLASFLALKNSNNIEFVIVCSGVLPELRLDIGAFCRFEVVNIPPDGVYSAYNRGVGCSSGDYVLFYGFDDIALPDMDKAIDQILYAKDSFDLVVCTSYMQGIGVAVPCRWHPAVLFKNFCHQGIFYKRSVFDKYEFDTKYLIQADHKLNIQVLADPSMHVHFSKMLVSYFSAGGLSSSRPDLVFRNDLVHITRDSFGLFFSWVVLAKQALVDFHAALFGQRFRPRRKN